MKGRIYKVKIDGTKLVIIDDVEDFKFDEVILVLGSSRRWIPRHFCAYEEDKVTCFPAGKSSLMHAPDGLLVSWANAIKYDKDLAWRSAE